MVGSCPTLQMWSLQPSSQQVQALQWLQILFRGLMWVPKSSKQVLDSFGAFYWNSSGQCSRCSLRVVPKSTYSCLPIQALAKAAVKGDGFVSWSAVGSWNPVTRVLETLVSFFFWNPPAIKATRRLIAVTKSTYGPSETLHSKCRPHKGCGIDWASNVVLKTLPTQESEMYGALFLTPRVKVVALRLMVVLKSTIGPS